MLILITAPANAEAGMSQISNANSRIRVKRDVNMNQVLSAGGATIAIKPVSEGVETDTGTIRLLCSQSGMPEIVNETGNRWCSYQRFQILGFKQNAPPFATLIEHPQSEVPVSPARKGQSLNSAPVAGTFRSSLWPAGCGVIGESCPPDSRRPPRVADRV